MNQLRRQILLNTFKICDLLIMMIAFAFATLATHFRENHIPLDDFLSMRIKIQNLILILAVLFVWYLIFVSFSLYHSKRLSGRWTEIKDIIKAP